MPFSQQSLFLSPHTTAHLGNRMTFKSTLEGRERANVLQQWHDPHFSHPKHKPQQEYWEQSLTHKAATFFSHCQHSQRLSRFSLIHRSCVTQSFQFTGTRDAASLPTAALPAEPTASPAGQNHHNTSHHLFSSAPGWLMHSNQAPKLKSFFSLC